MTIDYLVEYINREKTLRGICLKGDPGEVPIDKLYYLPEKYLNSPLWGISSENMQVIGIIIIESCRAEFSEVGEVSYYRWKVGGFHPVNQFLSPFKRPAKAPTCSFGCSKTITEEFFHKIPSFKAFVG